MDVPNRVFPMQDILEEQVNRAQPGDFRASLPRNPVQLDRLGTDRGHLVDDVVVVSFCEEP